MREGVTAFSNSDFNSLPTTMQHSKSFLTEEVRTSYIEDFR